MELDQFLKEASQREDINQQVKDMNQRRFEDLESRASTKEFLKEKQGEGKKKLEETTATSQKTSQERTERENQELWLLWKDGSTSPSRPQLPSLQTTVFKVWQVQSLCIMLQGWNPTSRRI